MQRIVGVLAGLVIAGLVASCVTPQQAGGPAGGATLIVNGREIGMAELVKSPLLRGGLKDFILMDKLFSECTKRGLKVDPAEIEKRLQSQKDSVLQAGMSWDDFLKQSGMTEEEMKENYKPAILFEMFAKSLANIDDNAVKEYWDKNKDSVLSRYITDNHLPESEKTKLTFEDCKATAREMAEGEAMREKQSEAFNVLVSQATLEIKGLGSPEESDRYVQMILGLAQEQARAATTGGTGVEQPGPPPATTEEPQKADTADTQPVPEGQGEAAPPADDTGGGDTETPPPGGEPAPGE